MASNEPNNFSGISLETTTTTASAASSIINNNNNNNNNNLSFNDVVVGAGTAAPDEGSNNANNATATTLLAMQPSMQTTEQQLSSSSTSSTMNNEVLSNNNNNNNNTNNNNTVKNQEPETTTTTKTTTDTTEIIDMEFWAKSLVGRWWEIFWEPNEEEEEEDNDVAEGDRGGAGGDDHHHQVNGTTTTTATEDVVMSIRGGGIEDDDGKMEKKNGSVKMEDTTAQSASDNTTNVAAAAASGGQQQQQQQQQQQASMPKHHHHHHHRERPRSSLQHNTSSATSTQQQQQRRRSSQQQQQQPYQHRPRFLDYDATKQSQQQQPPPQPVTRPPPPPPPTLLFNAVYHGPKLLLSLRHDHQGEVSIKEIAPDAPNANLVQSGDVLVGINGKRFPKSSSSSSSSSSEEKRKVDFNLVVTALRDTPRPMTVNFERRKILSSSTTTTTTTTTTTPRTHNISVAATTTVTTQRVNNVDAPKLEGGRNIQPPQQQLGLERGVGAVEQKIPTTASFLNSPMRQHSSHVGMNLSDNNSKLQHSKAATATERELQFPLETATDFPQGWTKRIIPRQNASLDSSKSSDTYYYSPAHGYKFRSRPEVRLFLELLTRVMGGDETIAMDEFRREKSRKRSETTKKTTTTTTMPQSMAMEEDEVEPLNNRLQKEMGEKKRRQNLFDNSQNESDATSTADDDDDDDAGGEAIDWYDGKILSYSDGNFVVYFLGDTEDVTYTMPLTPKIVRPSVRAWVKRTVALLSHDVDLTKEEVIHNIESIAGSLPPSTALPRDENELACVSKNGDESNHHMRLMEYSKLLETQIQLAKQLSPHADDDQSGGTVDGEDEGPGPFANKSYVKHLCSCLEESKKVCDWLSKEVDALNVFKRVNDGTSCTGQDSLATESVSKDSIQSFLVNGATFLQRILALTPHKVEAVPNEQNSRNGRKRRRVNTNELIEHQQNSINLSPNSLVSPDSLEEAMSSILDESSEENQQMLMTSTLKQIVSVLYLDLWQPHQDWIKEAKDMVYGKSTTFYSFEKIESHIQAAQKLTLFDISSWRIDLEAKLNRARFFEMEAWSAIKACTTLDESGNAAAASDSCLLALNRLENELSSSTFTAGEQSIMRNMNPLGKQSASANGTHSLTRDDIENAIKTRQWILDLMQAKTSRERASFVQVSDLSTRTHLYLSLCCLITFLYNRVSSSAMLCCPSYPLLPSVALVKVFLIRLPF